MKIDEAQERKEILKRYRELLRHAQPFLQGNDAKEIKKAFQVSAEAHKDMRRKSGEPYIYHPLEVAQICVQEIGLGTTAIVSALLHDVVEDTEIELKDIREQFGEKVAMIIDGLTKISGVTDHNTSLQAENFRKVIFTLSDDVRVILIKIADRLHNMRTLESMSRSKQLKISSETIYLYAPLAHRLGLYTIKSELEDLYLKYTDRAIYKDIASKIQDTKKARDEFIEKFIIPLRDSLSTEGFTFVIKGRPKSIHSVWTKMKKQNIPFEKVYDLFAVRIIIDDTVIEEEKAACWKVYSIVTDNYRPNPSRLRDWISTPRANGYESLHTTVMSRTGKWVEIQIRTRRMDDIAEKGYAAHWKYKDKDKSNKVSGLDIWIGKVRDMLENQDTSTIDFLDEFKSSLYKNEIFVFTPKGQLKILPHGATALDFAFDIHSEIGAKCIGAKINNKLLPISQELSNGDQIEILTSQKQNPKEDWLRFVVSSKAKSQIREYIRDEKKSVINEGKKITDKTLKKMKIEPNDNIYNDIGVFFDEKSASEFLFKVGNGNIKAKDLKKYKKIIEKRRNSAREVVNDAKSFTRMKKEKKCQDQNNDVLLIGEDMGVMDYDLAQCCNPISGDDVFGFITVSEGIKIHRTSCPNAIELMSHYGYRIIKARWASKKLDTFLVNVHITGTDRVGIINDITNVISSELEVNIRSIKVDTIDSIFNGNFTVIVKDTSDLNIMIEKLTNITGVEDIKRFEL